MKKIAIPLIILLASASFSFAADAAAAHEDHSPHPGIPEHATWARPLVIFIVWLFPLAWLIGLLVRAIMPEEIPPTHAHDEHHGHRDPEHKEGATGLPSHGH